MVFSRRELIDRLSSLTAAMRLALRDAEENPSRDVVETLRIIERTAESGKFYAEQLEQMLAGVAPIPDRRTEQRWPFQLAIGIMPLAVEGGFVPATLVDFSAHGFGLMTDAPLEPGTQLVIRLRLDKLYLATADVRNCRAHEGAYRVGARITGFAGPPEASQVSFEVALAEFVELMHGAAASRDT